MATEETAVAIVEPKKTKAVAKKGAVSSDLNLTTEQYLKAAVGSGLFKDTKNLAEAYMKVTLGASMGMDPVTAMSSIYIVQGKPSVSTNMLAARLKQSGRYRYKILEKGPTKCSIQFYELIEDWTDDGKQVKKWVEPGPPETYTIEQAKVAGLTKNPVWISHPANMVFNRAMSNGIKTYAPDLLSGVPIYTPDELDPSMRMRVTADGDVVPEAEYTVTQVTTHSETKAAEPDRLPEIQKLMEQTQTDQSAVLGYFGKDDLQKLTPQEQIKAIGFLENKKSAMPKA